MEEDDRLAARSAAAFPIEAVAVADVEPAALIGLDRRIEGASLGHRHVLFPVTRDLIRGLPSRRLQ
jgi:hypothetical protein